MKLTLHVWRQKDRHSPGQMVQYTADNISEHMSFLEMLDVVNEELVAKGEDPIAFDHDCREGICGSCGLMINGVPHGPMAATTTCQLHMRTFKDGDEIFIEPFRARAFPVIRDLVVDRSGFDRIVESGGYVSVNTGNAQDGNAVPIPKEDADAAFDAAACIACGACVATCKNGSAMLFASAKLVQLARLPQGQPERNRRAMKMVHAMDEAGFGNCTNTYDCGAVCPKEISVRNIAKMNREYIRAMWFHEETVP